MSQLPVRRVGNEQDMGIGPNGEFFIKEEVRTMSGRPVRFPEGLLQSAFGIYDADAFGAMANNVANDATAINNAITAAWLRGGGVVRLTPGRTYFISVRIDNLSNVQVVGFNTTIRHDGQPFRANALTGGGGFTGIQFQQSGLSGQPLVQNCVGFTIERCKFTAQRSSLGIYGNSVDCRVIYCEFTDNLSTCIEFNGTGCTRNSVIKCRFTNNTGFGVWMTGGSYGNLVDSCETTQNGIELVGITYDSYRNRIVNCHAEGCGDNGISVSGQHNVLIGNVTRGNSFHGLCLYGSRNVVSGHVSMNNGQAGGAYAGVAFTQGFGGAAQLNSVVGGVIDDDQATPTQAYCWKINGAGYTAWASGQTISGAGIFRANAGKLYRSTGAGTTGVTAPTHTSGTVSDGAVSWLYLDTFVSSVNEPAGNEITGVVEGRFLTGVTLDDTAQKRALIDGQVHPGYIPGKQYTLWNGPVANTAMAAVDTVYFYPFYIPRTINFVSGAIRVATGGAGSSVKVGIWANSPASGAPLGAPVYVDNTGVATTGTGQITINFGVGTLREGWVWIGIKTTGTPPTIVSTAGVMGWAMPQRSAVSAYGLSFGDAYANAMPTLAEGASFSTLNATGVPILALNT